MIRQFRFSPAKLRFSRHTIIIGSILFLALIFSACSTIRLQLNQYNQKESKLPRGMKAAQEDSDIKKKDSFVVTVEKGIGNFFIGEELIDSNQFPEKIRKALKDKPLHKKIVYVKAAKDIKFEALVFLFKLMREANVDRAGLVVINEGVDEKPVATPTRFEVKFPPENFNDQTTVKPNPLTLVVAINKNRDLSLNNEPMGNVSDTNKLTDKLKEIFKERENNGVFREGTNEIEKTIFIRASLSSKYGDVAKVIDAVKLSGAQPIGMQIDDLPN